MAVTEAVAARSAAPLTLRDRRGVALLGSFTAAHFSHHVPTSLLNPLLPFIRDGFGLSYGQSGLLVSAFALSLGLSNAPVGLLADRVGSRPVIVVGLLLTGVVSAALALAAAYWQLLALLVLMGVIAGSYHAPAGALLARAFPANTRGAVTGWHITGGHLSFFLAPLAAALLVGATGTWRTAYLWLGLAPILIGLVVWFIAPRAAHEGEARRAGGGDTLAVFREVGAVVRSVGPFVLLSIAYQMAYAALFAFTTLYLVDVRGVDAALAAILFGVPQLVGVLGAPAAGALSDRLGRQTVILGGLGLLGPALLALTLVPVEWLVVPLLVVGIASSLRQTVTEVLVMDSAPAHRRATVLGGYYLLSQELGGLAALLLGLLAGLFGLAAAFTGTTVVLAAASALVVAVVLAGAVRSGSGTASG